MKSLSAPVRSLFDYIARLDTLNNNFIAGSASSLKQYQYETLVPA